MKKSYESSLICPYCDYELDEPYLILSEDDSEAVIDCPSCDKKFNGVASFSVDYSTVGDCALNEELPHEFLDKSFEYEGKKLELYDCRKCFEEFSGWELPGGTHPKLKPEDFKVVGKKSIYEF